MKKALLIIVILILIILTFGLAFDLNVIIR
jgi:hypothetical protein